MRALRHSCLTLVLAIGASMLAARDVQAAVYHFYADQIYTGGSGTYPTGSVNFQFADTALNTVTLTVSAASLTQANDYIGQFGFNVNPSITLLSGNSLSITAVSIGLVAAPTITIGPQNSQNLYASSTNDDGYDVSFTNFSNAGGSRFDNSANHNTLVYTITRTGTNATLSAADFVFTSTNAVRSGYVAVKFFAGNIGVDTAVVPEPATLSVFGLSLLGLAALRRRRAA